MADNEKSGVTPEEIQNTTGKVSFAGLRISSHTRPQQNNI